MSSHTDKTKYYCCWIGLLITDAAMLNGALCSMFLMIYLKNLCMQQFCLKTARQSRVKNLKHFLFFFFWSTWALLSYTAPLPAILEYIKKKHWSMFLLFCWKFASRFCIKAFLNSSIFPWSSIVQSISSSAISVFQHSFHNISTEAEIIVKMIT